MLVIPKAALPLWERQLFVLYFFPAIEQMCIRDRDLMVARDLMLAAETGAHVHIAHVSTAGSAGLIREAKARGIHVTAETCPQYFMFTEEEILKKGTMARVNPPPVSYTHLAHAFPWNDNRHGGP